MSRFHRHALREPMVWLMLGLPLAAVLAGVATLLIALGGVADPVYGSVSRSGPVPADELRQQRAAARLGLAATLEIDASGEIALRLTPVDMPLPELRLTLVHPTDQRKDRSVQLVRDSGGFYRGHIADARQTRAVVIEPQDRSWRLSGRIGPGAASLVLGAGI
jgi:hypothetical protein